MTAIDPITAMTPAPATPIAADAWRRLSGTGRRGDLILSCCWPCSTIVRPLNQTAFDYKAILEGPSLAHPFGSDNFGRDILSRTIWAYRIDLQIALFGTLFPAIFGTLVGAIVGFFSGRLEAVFGVSSTRS